MQDFTIGFGKFGPNLRGAVGVGTDLVVVEQGNGVVTVRPDVVVSERAVPGQPTTPVLAPLPRGIRVTWNGMVYDADNLEVAPSPDVVGVVVHVSPMLNFEPSLLTKRGVILKGAGGFTFTAGSEYVEGLTDTYGCRLVALSSADVVGAPSALAILRAGQVATFDLEDNSVINVKMAADSVTARTIAALAIRTKLLETNELTADVIRTGTLFAAVTVSGALHTSEDVNNRSSMTSDGFSTMVDGLLAFRANTTGVYVKGQIDAMSGKIGNCVINADGLSVGMGMQRITLDPVGGIRAYKDDVLTFALAPGANSFVAPGLRTRQVFSEVERETASPDFVTNLGPGLLFTAPDSGNVRVDYSCWLSNNLASGLGSSVLTMELLIHATQAKVITANDFNGCTSEGIKKTSVQNFTLVPGLAPGVNYFIRLAHRTGNNGGIASFIYSKISVTPQP